MTKPADCTCQYPEVLARNMTGHDFKCPAHARLIAEIEGGRARPGRMIPEEIRERVRGCARCGGDHAPLAFRKLTRPIGPADEFTHWATCPTNGEPILLAVY